MSLTPINNCVVVELLESYEYVESPDKQYATKNKGIVTAVADDKHKYLISKKVYFPSFQDDIIEEIDGKKYSVIKYEDIRMYSDV